MRAILILCGVILIAAIALLVWRSTRPERYGNPFTGAPAITIKAAAAATNDTPAVDVNLTGTIVRQCPVSGCWFYIKDEAGNQVRIEMDSVAPTLPQRLGRTANVEGRLIRQDGSVVLVGNAVEFK